MKKITSRDSTPIAYHRRGAGSPLVLVHGSGASNPVVGWPAVVPGLEERFTVYSMDRRGYGESGNRSPYALEREFEDVAALVDSIGGPVQLLGHSFGALCALGAALLTGNLARLILYEPAITFPDMPFYPPGAVERLQALLDAGKREEVLRVIFCEIAGMPDHEFEQLQGAPTWAARVERAHLLVRESWAEERYLFDARRFRDLKTPTLLLSGGDSPPLIRKVTEALAATLPNSRIAVLRGQQHIAMLTAPDLFLQEVLAFLNEPGDARGVLA